MTLRELIQQAGGINSPTMDYKLGVDVELDEDSKLSALLGEAEIKDDWKTIVFEVKR